MQKKEQAPELIMIAPHCNCCPEPELLLPRADLQPGLAVCPQTGQLYRAAGNRYVRTTLPQLSRPARLVQGVRIDLSRAGYA